jgi:Uma2 family endonuclease
MTAVLVPQRHVITAEEYLRMGEAGVFDPEARLELIEGEIIEMAPIGSPHAATVAFLTRLLVRAVGDSAIVWAQNPLVANSRSVPQPDVLLVKPRSDFYRSGHPRADDTLLAVEVADSTLAFDLRTKMPLYAKSCIRELWIVDVNDAKVHVFRDPEGGVYKTAFVAGVGDTLKVLALSMVKVEVKALF